MPVAKVKKCKRSEKFSPYAPPETIEKVERTAKLITEGKSRATIIEWLKSEYGIAYDTARHYYTEAVHYLLPVDDSEYRKDLVQVNFERLDKIIQESMAAGNYRIAREAIAEQNKMCGVTGQGVQIGIANDKQNDTQQIIIKFDS